jgi:hypothetical protein
MGELLAGQSPIAQGAGVDMTTASIPPHTMASTPPSSSLTRTSAPGADITSSTWMGVRARAVWSKLDVRPRCVRMTERRYF